MDINNFQGVVRHVEMLISFVAVYAKYETTTIKWLQYSFKE